MRLGIDWGTTRTVVAYCDSKKGCSTIKFRGEKRKQWDAYPALAAEKNGTWVFGIDAVEKATDAEWNLLSSFKRVLSNPTTSLDTVISFDNQEVRIFDLLTQYLTALRHDLLERSNLPKIAKGEELEVLIATPVFAHSTQRFLTMEAFRKAGFVVVGMQSEPTAAGIDYARRYSKTFTNQRDQVLIYDLGGGTFDVSLLEQTGDSLRVIKTAGLPRLGGDDFDSALVALTLEKAGITSSSLSDASMARLRLLCQQKKEALHPNTRKISIELGSLLSEEEKSTLDIANKQAFSVTTKEFYNACLPVLEETLATTQQVLTLADDDASRLAGIYVVGGASRLPIVGRTLKKKFGKRYHRANSPSAATAIGLAYLVEAEEQLISDDSLDRHFGVFREAEDGAKASFDVLIPAHTLLPTDASQPTSFRRTYQPAHNIGYYRFVECDYVHNYNPDGNVSVVAEVVFPYDPSLQHNIQALEDVEVKRYTPRGAWIEESYNVDSNGCITFSIKDLESGYTVEHQLS